MFKPKLSEEGVKALELRLDHQLLSNLLDKKLRELEERLLQKLTTFIPQAESIPTPKPLVKRKRRNSSIKHLYAPVVSLGVGDLVKLDIPAGINPHYLQSGVLDFGNRNGKKFRTLNNTTHLIVTRVE